MFICYEFQCKLIEKDDEVPQTSIGKGGIENQSQAGVRIGDKLYISTPS